MTAAERAVKNAWTGGAARLHFGRCDDCERTKDDDGSPLLVARQERCRRFQCLGCFSLRPTGSAARRAA